MSTSFSKNLEHRVRIELTHSCFADNPFPIQATVLNYVWVGLEPTFKLYQCFVLPLNYQTMNYHRLKAVVSSLIPVFTSPEALDSGCPNPILIPNKLELCGHYIP